MHNQYIHMEKSLSTLYVSLFELWNLWKYYHHWILSSLLLRCCYVNIGTVPYKQVKNWWLSKPISLTNILKMKVLQLSVYVPSNTSQDVVTLQLLLYNELVTSFQGYIDQGIDIDNRWSIQMK